MRKSVTIAFSFAVAALLCVPTLGQSLSSALDDAGVTDPAARSRAMRLRNEVRSSGCGLDICFALTSRRSAQRGSFRAQQNFVNLVSAVLAASPDSNTRLAAYQYGDRGVSISPITSNVESFLRRVDGARSLQSINAELSPALSFCRRQLRTGGRGGAGGANLMVVFAERLSGVGVPREEVESFRGGPRGGRQRDIVGVGVGPNVDRGALRALSGPNGQVLRIPPANPDGGAAVFRLLDIAMDFVASQCSL